MDKKLTFSLLVLLMTIKVYCSPVDVETARRQAETFIGKQSLSRGLYNKANTDHLQIKHVQRQKADEAPLLYVFGYENSKGYVIVSGDDSAEKPILGYSTTGTFSKDKIPCCLRYWLDEYCRQLSLARQNSRPVRARAQEPKTEKDYIAPLVTARWGQHLPFNKLCPLDEEDEEGRNCATGCTATAMAQVMYYYKWPKKGVGSNSYIWKGKTLSADFGSTTYQWDKMKDRYNLINYEDDPDDAVATLMYHCGIAAETDYGTQSPGSMSAGRLKMYFNYSSSTSDINTDDLKEAEELIYSELCANRPILFAGGTTEGHAMICDGYDNGYYHFNFGWNDNGDCFYTLNAWSYAFRTRIIYGIRKPGETLTINGIQYEYYQDGTAVLVKADPEMAIGDFTIPSSIEVEGRSYEVTNICDWAFQDCMQLLSVTIPNSVKTIGSYAFYECQRLTTVTVPDDLILIGNGAFSSCYKLVSIPLPNSIKCIGREAFKNCSNLMSPIYTSTDFIYMPPKYKGDYVINEGITTIQDKAFMDCVGLTSITIPNSVETIGDQAFYGCKGLTNLYIPRNVKSILPQSFLGCNNLTSIVVDKDNTIYDSRDNCNAIIVTDYIGNTAIRTALVLGCSNTIIPNSVDEISYYAFYHRSNLTSINIPNSVTSIKAHAFEGCSGLTSVTIPSSVSNIGLMVFRGCDNLSSITVDDENKYYDSRNNCNAIIQTRENNLIQGCKNSIIPDGVKRIRDAAFKDCSGLTSICIPNSVTEIEVNAFQNCTKLTSVIMSDSLTSIGTSAFDGCINLSSVTIPYSVELIGNWAFNRCISLENVKALPDVPPFLYDNSFYNFSVPLEVPKGCKEAYQTAQGWKKFTNISEAEKGYYKLIYLVDNEEYKSYKTEEGTPITLEAEPTKEGYTFSGWSEIPETMPDHDVTVTGTFSINSYKLTYMIDDKVYKETMYEYGATITPEPQPESDYATFEWTDLPQTMPAHDVVVNASYTSGIIELLMTTQRNIRIFSPNGKKLDKLQKGLNIVVQDDGTVKIVVIK